MGNYIHIQSYKELKVYNNAVKTAMEVFDTSRRFPAEEWKSLGEPMRLAARGVAAAIAQAWERRRFKTPFVAKLCMAQSEAAALQVWMDIAFRCGYLKLEDKMRLDDQCGLIMAQLHRMINSAPSWLIRPATPATAKTEPKKSVRVKTAKTRLNPDMPVIDGGDGDPAESTASPQTHKADSPQSSRDAAEA